MFSTLFKILRELKSPLLPVALSSWLGIFTVGFAANTPGFSSIQIEFFEKRIRPVLVQNCLECHGSEGKPKGDLRLDSRDAVLRGGKSGPAIVVGDPEKSILIQAVRHLHPDLAMPKKGPRLADSVLADLSAWIADGAADPRTGLAISTAEEWQKVFKARLEQWCFQPVKSSPVPNVQNVSWAEMRVDRFILAQLEAAKLKPAPRASSQAWLRRIYFVLSGLPPSPADVLQFLRDPSTEARARTVERLLASPHFGERWARHWMDLVRFADSYGHEQDFTIPHSWRYRDYIVRALNADVPYNQWVTEHVAGDLLDVPRRNPSTGLNESIIGTGFWYLHQATHSPVDPLLDEADRIDNQVDVLSKTFLGLTVACARCHNHKFDAISAQDYYSLTAILRGTRQDIAYLDPDGSLEAKVTILAALHEGKTGEIQSLLNRYIRNKGVQISPFISAALEVIEGLEKNSDRALTQRPNHVFENFENGAHDRWTLSGDAFGPQPNDGIQTNQQSVEGYLGRGLATSSTRGDTPRGALQSRPFRIEYPFIHSLVGGGNSTHKVRFVLRVDGSEVRTASGSNRDSLEPVVWDVKKWIGQEGALEIIDEDTHSWGHIHVDHIVFSDAVENVFLRRPIASVAKERQLDIGRLNRWVSELVKAASDPQHPLQNLRTHSKLAPKPNQVVIPPVKTRPPSDLTFSQYFPSGQAFQQSTNKGNKWRLNGDGIEFFGSRIQHSGLWADGLQGTLRTPSFTLSEENLHLKLAGRQGQVRLIICRYGLREFNPLLFEQTLFEVNTSGDFTWFTLSSDIKRHLGRTAYLEFIDNGDGFLAIDRIVLSQNPKPPMDSIWSQELLATETLTDRADRIEALVNDQLDRWLRNDPGNESLSLASWLSVKGLLDWNQSNSVLTTLREQARKAGETLPPPVRVLAMAEGTPEETRIYVRGDPKQLGSAVVPRFLEALAGPQILRAPQGSGRRELAASLVADTNPLLHRVFVNRVWAHVFGVGLVPTVDNFGAMGRMPSHPEVLDDLVLSFRQTGGSIKQLLRTLCLSETFAMSSQPSDSDAEARDPENILLHRMPLRRLEGEAIRDSLLAVSGSLDSMMGGPAVLTYFTPFMGDRMWVRNPAGPLDGAGRRTVYQETRRNYLAPFLTAFDLPLPDTTVGQRHSSNVPGQALALMNDPFVRLQAIEWAEQLRKAGRQSFEERADSLYIRALGRHPSSSEVVKLLTFLRAHQEAHQTESGSVDLEPTRKAWVEACHLMFMLKEFIYVP